jgi:hypothetical protein
MIFPRLLIRVFMRKLDVHGKGKPKPRGKSLYPQQDRPMQEMLWNPS